MEPDKKQILNRLATIEGHLRAIQRMIEQDRCCRDILSQTYAIERALKAFEVALVDHHLVSRLPTARAEERSSESCASFSNSRHSTRPIRLAQRGELRSTH